MAFSPYEIVNRGISYTSGYTGSFPFILQVAYEQVNHTEGGIYKNQTSSNSGGRSVPLRYNLQAK